MQYGEKLYRTKFIWIWRKSQAVHGFRYRIDPVPFISNRKHHFGTYYKIPRVMNEKRQWDNEYGRRKRSPRCLPDPWDDYIRADIHDRSWKRIKKRKQWM